MPNLTTIFGELAPKTLDISVAALAFLKADGGQEFLTIAGQRIG